MTTQPDWLQIHRGDVPLIVSFPHTGTELPDALAAQFVSRVCPPRRRLVVLRCTASRSSVAPPCAPLLSRSSRRQPRPSGHLAVPCQNTTCLCPASHLLPTSRFTAMRPGRGGDRAPPRYWFAPYTRPLPEIARPACPSRTVVLYAAPLSLAHPAPVSCHLPQFNLVTTALPLDNALTMWSTPSVWRWSLSHGATAASRAATSPAITATSPRRAHAAEELACRGYLHYPEALDYPSCPRHWLLITPPRCAPALQQVQMRLDSLRPGVCMTVSIPPAPSLPAAPRCLQSGDRSPAAHADEHLHPDVAEAPAGWWSIAARARRARLGKLTTRSSRPAGLICPGPSVQSGKPGCVFAPRGCPARADFQLHLVPRLATGDTSTISTRGPGHVRPYDRALDLHRRPGHRAGTYANIRGDLPPHYNASWPQVLFTVGLAAWVRSGLPRLYPAPRAGVECRKSSLDMRLRTGYLDTCRRPRRSAAPAPGILHARSRSRSACSERRRRAASC